MPVYPYRCPQCGHEEDEIVIPGAQASRSPFCPMCSSLMQRAYDKQNVAVRGDIEPGYDVSLGDHVGSRRDLREKLAYKNAYCPDLMQGSEPSAGRLTPEERAIVEGRPVQQRKTIFERRKEPGWGQNPDIGAVLQSSDPNAGDGIVITEGDYDHQQFMGEVKERVNRATRSRKDGAG